MFVRPLQIQPLAHRAQIVTQMQCARRLDATEDLAWPVYAAAARLQRSRLVRDYITYVCMLIPRQGSYVNTHLGFNSAYFL